MLTQFVYLILVHMNLQHSQAQPYGIFTRVIYLTQTYLYVEHHAEKQLVSTIFKVFGMTRSWVD